MELFSLLYLLFVAILVFLYYCIPHCCKALGRYQWCILLAGSLGFYLYAGRAHILFLLFTSFTVWAGGLLLAEQEKIFLAEKKKLTSAGASVCNRHESDGRIIQKDNDRNTDKAAAERIREARKALKTRMLRRKRWILSLDLLLNFGILAYLKYFHVLISSLQEAGGTKPLSSVILPLGISFYTFQTIGYLIDQYGGKYPPERNFARFLLFASWFPQLLEGPINRYDQLSGSLFEEHRFDHARAGRALLVVLYGFMKKYAIADMLSPSIGYIFDTGYTAQRDGCMIVFGILLYSAQQYADFSGGIDIVMGVSELFGVSMMPNFRQPYFAISLGDFWRRWHISLGAWMRDYVFYPFALLKPMQKFGKWCTKHLGKHAGRTLPACIANIVVFVIVGLWHGPESHYLLWGLYNGIVIALSDLTAPFWKKCGTALYRHLPGRNKAAFCHVLRVVRTFIIVNIGWYFDRIYRFDDCMAAFRQTFTAFHLSSFAEDVRTILLSGAGSAFTLAGSYLTALLGSCLLFVVSFQTERGNDVSGAIPGSAWKTGACTYICLLLIFGSFVFTQAAGGFMYANF